MNEKPEALRLAEWIESDPIPGDNKIASTLRRLHAENERLREALQGIAEVDLTGCDLTAAGYIAHALIGRAKAALRREDV